MKKILLIAVVTFFTTSVFSQSEKYTKKMTELVAGLDTLKTSAEFTELANNFERVADAEKTQWLAYYYAALCRTNAATFSLNGMGDNSAITDPAADKAQTLLDKALALKKDSSETYVLKKMIYGLRMMGNPMQRYMEWGTKADAALKKARSLDTTNPRTYLLEAQDKYYTPEQFGGSKKEAKKLFEKAKALYATFKPETALHPKWGLGQTMYFLSLYKEK